GQIAITAGIDYGAAIFTDALLQLLWPSTFKGHPHEVIYVYAVILFFHALMNTFSVKLVALLNDISVWWHVVGVLVISGVLIIVPDHHQSVSTVFTKTINNSGFSHGWLWFVLLLGLLQAQYTFTGYDASERGDAERVAFWCAGCRDVVRRLSRVRLHPRAGRDVRDPDLRLDRRG